MFFRKISHGTQSSCSRKMDWRTAIYITDLRKRKVRSQFISCPAQRKKGVGGNKSEASGELERMDDPNLHYIKMLKPFWIPIRFSSQLFSSHSVNKKVSPHHMSLHVQPEKGLTDWWLRTSLKARKVRSQSITSRPQKCDGGGGWKDCEDRSEEKTSLR